MDWWDVLGYAAAPLGAASIVWLGVKIKLLILNYMPNGWIKDQLLRERWHSAASESHRRITRGQKSFR